MDRLIVKHWRSFQHYKHRNPPWIRLHKKLLDDYEFQCLQDASKALALCIWLLAAESDDGSIPADFKVLAFRFRKSCDEIRSALIPLIEKGFLIDASNVLAACKQNRTTETETEKEKNLTSFDSYVEQPKNPIEKINGNLDQAREVIAFLNKVTGRAYEPVEANLKLIRARLKEADLATIKRVIAFKAEQWLETEWDAYLRPATLFNATKFAQYRGELPPLSGVPNASR